MCPESVGLTDFSLSFLGQVVLEGTPLPYSQRQIKLNLARKCAFLPNPLPDRYAALVEFKQGPFTNEP
jgi:hypothetical protein